MSENATRIPIEKARRVYAFLLKRWGMNPEACELLGSARRGRETIGDLDILFPLPRGYKGGKIDAEEDRAFQAINASVENPTPAGLFASAPMSDGGPPIGSAERGLGPGFKAASLLVTALGVDRLPVQVYRAGPAAWGWATLMRTGPDDFGQWFLGKWKKRFGIPLGDETRRASIAGHLVDAGGTRVPVWSERACFTACGLDYVPPGDRDGYVDRIRANARERWR